MELPGFERFDFPAEGLTKPVYKRGTGPAVVLIHELPGMSVECVDLAARLADEGFTIYMPLLFGEPLQNYGTKPLFWGCVWKEFDFLGRRAERPVTGFLRALARRAAAETKGKVGAIGMCFTGCFALTMLLDEEVVAPVLSQPSPPSMSKAALGLRGGELANAKRRVKDEKIPVLAFRFEGDSLCKSERFETLRAEFGDAFKPVVLEGKGHSVLTYHFKGLPEAEKTRVWSALLDHLRARLR
jgi:dienelactone hydrolase